MTFAGQKRSSLSQANQQVVYQYIFRLGFISELIHKFHGTQITRAASKCSTQFCQSWQRGVAFVNVNIFGHYTMWKLRPCFVAEPSLDGNEFADSFFDLGAKIVAEAPYYALRTDHWI